MRFALSLPLCSSWTLRIFNFLIVSIICAQRERSKVRNSNEYSVSTADLKFKRSRVNPLDSAHNMRIQYAYPILTTMWLIEDAASNISAFNHLLFSCILAHSTFQDRFAYWCPRAYPTFRRAFLIGFSQKFHPCSLRQPRALKYFRKFHRWPVNWPTLQVNLKNRATFRQLNFSECTLILSLIARFRQLIFLRKSLVQVNKQLCCDN